MKSVANETGNTSNYSCQRNTRPKSNNQGNENKMTMNYTATLSSAAFNDQRAHGQGNGLRAKVELTCKTNKLGTNRCMAQHKRSFADRKETRTHQRPTNEQEQPAGWITECETAQATRVLTAHRDSVWRGIARLLRCFELNRSAHVAPTRTHKHTRDFSRLQAQHKQTKENAPNNHVEVVCFGIEVVQHDVVKIDRAIRV